MREPLHSQRRRGLRWAAEGMAAAAIYVACALLFFAPTLRSFDSALIGPPSDNMQYQWVMWWAAETVGDPDREFLWTNSIFYPEGSSLAHNDSSWYNLSLSLALGRWLPRVATYNALVLSTFVFAALAAFLLIRSIVDDFTIAVIGGFIYGFNPSHFAHSHYHLSVSSSQFLPLFALFYTRAMRRWSPLDMAAATGFCVLNALCNWNYLVYTMFFAGFAYVYYAVRRRAWLLPEVLGRSALLFAVAALLLSPLLVPMVLGSPPQEGVRTGGHDWYIADVAGLFIPDPYHLLGDLPLFGAAHVRYRGNPWEATVYLGLVNLAIVGLALWKRREVPWRWVLGALAFLILALGTRVTVLGHQLPIPLPYEVMQHVPFLESSRAPSRWIILVYLFLAVLVSISLRELLAHPDLARRRALLLGLAALLVFYDYDSVCREVTPVELPAAYATIEPSPERFGVLDLPGGTRNQERYMMYQMLHGFPIMQGALSRKTNESLVDRLSLDDPAKLVSQLKEHRVRYVVVHKLLEVPRGEPLPLEGLHRELPPVFEDKEQVVFRVY